MLRRSYSAADAALRSSSNAPLAKGFAGKSVRPTTSPSVLEEVGSPGRLSRASEPSTRMKRTHSETSGAGAHATGSRDGEGAASLMG